MAFEWILQIPVLFFSVIFHEVSHGWAAYLQGDSTAEQAGRLTFNPLPHVDPFGTLLLPAMCVLGGGPVFGWAKPVPVDPTRLRGKHAALIVAAVGPLSNVLLAAVAALALKYIVYASALDIGMEEAAATALRFGLMLNLYLAAFNLLPVFPLDGSHVAMELLPRHLARTYEQHAPYGFLIIVGLMMLGLLGTILSPMVWFCVRAFAAVGLLR